MISNDRNRTRSDAGEDDDQKRGYSNLFAAAVKPPTAQGAGTGS